MSAAALPIVLDLATLGTVIVEGCGGKTETNDVCTELGFLLAACTAQSIAFNSLGPMVDQCRADPVARCQASCIVAAKPSCLDWAPRNLDPNSPLLPFVACELMCLQTDGGQSR